MNILNFVYKEEGLMTIGTSHHRLRASGIYTGTIDLWFRRSKDYGEG